MSPQQDQAHRLAFAIVNTIAKMTPKERDKQPSGRYGENFNGVLDASKKAAPNVAAALWPRPVTVAKCVSTGEPFTDSSYAEVETYARQVAAILQTAG